MISFYLIACLSILPIGAFLLTQDSKQKIFVFSFSFIVIGFSIFSFTSKYSFLGSIHKELISSNFQEAAKLNIELNEDFFIRFNKYIEDDQKNTWLEEIILYSINIDSLNTAEQLMEFAEPVFNQTDNQVRFYALYTILRDKKFPEYALANLNINVSVPDICLTEQISFNLFIENGPKIPIAQLTASDINKFEFSLSNSDSLIPGFDLASALINQEKIVLNSALNCKDNSSFLSTLKLKKVEKNKALLAIEINEKDWFVNAQ